MTDETRQIPIASIAVSGTNPRRSYSQPALEELADSIRAHGVVQAILVRPKGEAFELVCGERRLRASRLAGLPAIPARIRDLDDRQVAEIQLIENSQREDVHPVEEAHAIRRLRDEHGYPIEEIASKLGRPAAFVHRRLALCNLCPEAEQALTDEAIGVGVAELIARLAPEQQRMVLEDLVYDDEPPPTVADVRNYVQGRIARRLAVVPWRLDDGELLPMAGACSTCPKRSSAQQGLFGDFTDDSDRCLDVTCYVAKKDAHWSLQAEAARARGAEVLDEEASRQIFRHGRHYLSDRRYVELDAPCPFVETPEHVDPPTWRDVIDGRDVHEIVADVEREAVPLVRVEDVRRALEEDPRDGDPDQLDRSVGATGAATNESLEKERQKEAQAAALEREVERRVCERIYAHCAELGEKFASDPSLDIIAKLLAHLTRGTSHLVWSDVARRVAKRRGADDAIALRTAIGTAPTGVVLSVLAELVLESERTSSERALIAHLFDIDEAAIRKEARADLKAKAKAKAAKEKARAKKAALADGGAS